MALNDLLNAAFNSEQAANRRMAQMPQIRQADTSSIPGPIMPFAPDTGSSDDSRTLASLLPALMGGGNGGGGGMGRGGEQQLGAPGNAPPGSPIDLANDIARRLERKGFQVSGLEGFQGTGQISSGHIDNSQHYSGHAGDVTYGGAGRWNNEMAALDWAERMLNRRYGDALTELIWREPDHWDHLHYGTRPGG